MPSPSDETILFISIDPETREVLILQDGIHPKYVEATISCVCGNVVELRSTVAKMHVDVCSVCHPFYTGKRQMLADRGGRIEQFNRRYQRGTAPATPSAGQETAEA